MRKNILLVFIIIGTAFTSCQKEAGEGGNSTITGRIWVRNYNANFTQLNGQYAGADEDVYIIYGDDVTYGDRQKASPDGIFEFKYLRKGDYRIYIYSKDSTMQSPSGKVTFTRDAAIKSKKETVDLGTITIIN